MPPGPSLKPALMVRTQPYMSADCPTAVTVSPSSGPFTAGDEVTCSSDGYPDVSIRWTDGSGAEVSSTNTVTIPTGSFTLTCIATGTLAGDCSATGSISGDVGSKYRKQHATLVTITHLRVGRLRKLQLPE